MKSRLDLHKKLCELLGSKNVYFQPPESVKMSYPAIVYKRSDIQNIHADNNPYLQFHGYEITVIDKNPDSDIPKAISQLPLCRFNRHFNADNLNHDVFVLYTKF